MILLASHVNYYDTFNKLFQLSDYFNCHFKLFQLLANLLL